jgi:hypothetical protein
MSVTQNNQLLVKRIAALEAAAEESFPTPTPSPSTFPEPEPDDSVLESCSPIPDVPAAWLVPSNTAPASERPTPETPRVLPGPSNPGYSNGATSTGSMAPFSRIVLPTTVHKARRSTAAQDTRKPSSYVRLGRERKVCFV